MSQCILRDYLMGDTRDMEIMMPFGTEIMGVTPGVIHALVITDNAEERRLFHLRTTGDEADPHWLSYGKFVNNGQIWWLFEECLPKDA